MFLDEKIKSCQTALCHLVIGEKIWFASATYNALFYYNLLEERLGYVGKFPQEDDNRNAMFSNMVLYNNRLFFFPYSARCIQIYNMQTNCFEEQIEVVSDTYWKYATAVEVENHVYLFSAQTAEISMFNLETHVINVLYTIDISNEPKSYAMSFWNNCFKVNENIYTCLSERPAIIKLNTFSNKVCIKRFETEEDGFIGAMKVDNQVLFFQRKSGNIFTWNGKSEYSLAKESFTRDQINYLLNPRMYGCSFGATDRTRFFVVPDSGSWMMELKIKGKTIQLIRCNIFNEINTTEGQVNSRIQIANNTVSFVSGAESNIWLWNLDNKISKKSIKTPEKFFEEHYKGNYLYAVEDPRICSLDNFLNSIKKQEPKRTQSKIGQEIYLNIKDRI